MNPDALKAIRILNGLTQAELARQSGVSQGHISQLESGDRGARPATARRLAEVLGVPMGALLRSSNPGAAA